MRLERVDRRPRAPRTRRARRTMVATRAAREAAASARRDHTPLGGGRPPPPPRAVRCDNQNTIIKVPVCRKCRCVCALGRNIKHMDPEIWLLTFATCPCRSDATRDGSLAGCRVRSCVSSCARDAQSTVYRALVVVACAISDHAHCPHLCSNPVYSRPGASNGSRRLLDAMGPMPTPSPPSSERPIGMLRCWTCCGKAAAATALACGSIPSPP
jgi:hypothetical protein